MYTRKNNYFIKEPYIGSDGRDFAIDFAEYLQEIIDKGRWSSMNEHQLFLDGGKQLLKEIIAELKPVEN